jgi:hypothetical protein
MRNGAWLKHKHRRSEAFLITSWAPAQPGRPESFFLARLSEGGLEPAGSVSLGLSSDERERLRAALEAEELPQRGRRQRVRPVEPVALDTLDFHGPAHGPVRDPVLRSVELSAADGPRRPLKDRMGDGAEQLRRVKPIPPRFSLGESAQPQPVARATPAARRL